VLSFQDVEPREQGALEDAVAGDLGEATCLADAVSKGVGAADGLVVDGDANAVGGILSFHGERL
jgi:hypothetical protein